MAPPAQTHDAPDFSDGPVGKPRPLPSILTVQDLTRAGARRLAQADIETAAIDARLLVAHGLKKNLEDLIRDGRDEVTPVQQQRIERYLARRLAREPVAYITGEKEFWSIEFAVTRNTLIPRPESEVLVAQALEVLARHGDRAQTDEPLSVLDLGTGSGCLLLSILAQNPGARGVGVDIDRKALDVARENAGRCGVGHRAFFVKSDWGANIQGRFNLVITNPPYICSRELVQLAPEVCHYEPRGALDGGSDGLGPYRQIAKRLPRLLVPGGFVIAEIGSLQARDVKKILFDLTPLSFVELHQDLAQRPRCLMGRYLG